MRDNAAGASQRHVCLGVIAFAIAAGYGVAAGAAGWRAFRLRAA